MGGVNVLSRLTVGKKLIIGFGLMLARVLGSGLGSLRMIESLGGTLDSAVEVTAKKIQLAESLPSAFRQVRVACTLAEISLINSTILGEIKLGGRDQPACGGC